MIKNRSAVLAVINTQLKAGSSVAQACKKAHISVPTFYNWRRGDSKTAKSSSIRSQREDGILVWIPTAKLKLVAKLLNQ